MFDKIQRILEELDKELKEATMTSNVDGFATPHAFTRTPMSKKDKKKNNSISKGKAYVDIVRRLHK